MYNLRILVNGRPIPIYNGRNGKKWVEARKGTRFEVKVENDSYNRILTVVSVDGLNVIDGKHEDPMESPGYILNRNSSISIPGWLIDENKVREFLFENKENSYSKKIGADQSNIGVIGAAIITEKTYNWNYAYSFTYPLDTTIKINETPYLKDTSVYSCSSNSSSNITNLSATIKNSTSVNEVATEELGVGSGDYKDFSTVTENFIRDKIKTILTVYYDTRENLIKNGIIVESGPRPFPISGPYCPNV